MASTGDVRIAGSRTASDWKAFQHRLKHGAGPDAWKEAFDDYFHARLLSRYLDPIRVLQGKHPTRGEGFSIATIQCALIEFLETTVQGISYRYRSKGSPPLGEHEYSKSANVFVSFLASRPPFAAAFTKPVALDFYQGVRCGLLHEARTKNGWRILARNGKGLIVDARTKVMYRDNFQTGLLYFVDWYKGELASNTTLQQALIRKFDSLCV